MDPHRPQERSEVADALKWDLGHLFQNEGEWRRVRQSVADGIERLGSFRISITKSAAELLEALACQWQLRKDLSRLTAYATLVAAQDTRLTEPRALGGEVDHLTAAYRQQAAFIDTALASLDEARLEDFFRELPQLGEYRPFIANQRRRAAHIFTEREEQIMAGATTHLSYAVTRVYETLTEQDVPYRTMALRSSGAVRVDRAGYLRLRESADRRERKQSALLYFRALGSFRHTFATILNASVRKALFAATTRRYDSTLALIMDAASLSPAVYEGLILGARRHLPTLHRYLRLRRSLIGVGTLHAYDLHAPSIVGAEPRYSVDEARQHVCDAVAPLGRQYADVVRRAFTDRWMDLLPAAGKRTGAFTSAGSYESHPYALLNYAGSCTDLDTMAREVGRVAHRYIASRAQPYPSATPDFLTSEMAALVSQELVTRHLLRTAPVSERMFLLARHLETIRLSIFRHAQLAEFERRIHRMAQNGDPLLADTLAGEYLGLARTYGGHDTGTCVIDEYVRHEWSSLPQVYATYAFFQFALASCAALAVVEMLDGDERVAPRYVRALAAGNSAPPAEIVKSVGIDLTSDDLLTAAMRRLNQEIDELETLTRMVAGRHAAGVHPPLRAHEVRHVGVHRPV